MIVISFIFFFLPSILVFFKCLALSKDKSVVYPPCHLSQIMTLWNVFFVIQHHISPISHFAQCIDSFKVLLNGCIEVAKHIKKIILDKKLVLDPVVIVDFYSQQVSVIGEVGKPGKYNIDKDRFTILDALSLAGDLTIQGKRENITVLREEYGVQKAYVLNLNNAEQFHASPAYYLQQNDIVYVEPNSSKTGQSTVNGNTLRSVSFWMSLASFALTLVTFFTRF